MAAPAEFPAPWDKAVHVKFYVSDILLFLRDILASNDTDGFFPFTSIVKLDGSSS